MSALSALLLRLHSLPDEYAPLFDDRLLLQLIIALSNPSPSHLVLRIGTEDDRLSAREREELTRRVEAELAWILKVIFHLVPHIVHCSNKTSASAFVRSLLLPLSPPAVTLSPSQLHSRRAASHRSERSLRAPTIKQRPRSNTLTQLVNEAAAGNAGRVPKSPTLSIAGSGLRIPPSPSYSSSLLGPADALVEDPAPYSDASKAADESSAGEDLYPPPHRPKPGDAAHPRRRGMSTSTTTSVLQPAQSGSLTPRKYGSLGSRRGSELSVSVNGPESGPMVRRPTSPRMGSTASQRSPTPGSVGGISYFGHQHAVGGSSRLGERRPSIASVASQNEMAPSSPLLTPTAPTSRMLRTRSNSPGVYKALSPSAAGPGSPLSQAGSPSMTINRRPSSTLTGHTLGSPSTARPRSAERRASQRQWEQDEVAARQLPQVLILSQLDRARKSAQQALVDILREGRVSFGERRRPSLILHPSDAQSNQDDASQQGEDGHHSEVKMLPHHFLVVALVCERRRAKDEPAQDGGWCGISRHLLDRFAHSLTLDWNSINHSDFAFTAPDLPSNLPVDGAPAPLDSQPLARRFLEAVWISPALSCYIADLFSALRSHPMLEGRMLSARAEKDLDALLRVWVTLNSQPSSAGEVKQLTKDDDGREGERMVGPADVLSVLMSVVGHRVVLRDVESEKSVFWGASERRLAGRREGWGGVEAVVREIVQVV